MCGKAAGSFAKCVQSCCTSVGEQHLDINIRLVGTATIGTTMLSSEFTAFSLPLVSGAARLGSAELKLRAKVRVFEGTHHMLTPSAELVNDQHSIAA
jgi:hypothetical protein